MRWEETPCSSSRSQSPPLAICCKEPGERPHGLKLRSHSFWLLQGPLLDLDKDMVFFPLKPQKSGKCIRKSACEQEENIEGSSHLIVYLTLLSYILYAANILVLNSHKYSSVTSEPCM